MNKFYQKAGRLTILLAAAVLSHIGLKANVEYTPSDATNTSTLSIAIDFTQEQGINCAGAAEASITAHPTGGQAPYTYLWDTGATTATITGLGAGSYFVIVTDNLGAQNANAFVVTEPTPIEISFDITPSADCQGPGTGAVDATVTGGTGAITYEWSNGETIANISNLDAGSYTLTARDENNCESVATAVVAALDDTPPVIAVKSITVALDENGLAQIPAEAVDDGSTDDCGIVNATLTKNNFTCADLGENALTYTVFDAAGNSTADEAIIFIVDDIAPVAVAADVTISLDADGFVTLDPDILGANSTDNCSIVNKTLSVDELSCLNIGKTDVVLTVVDADGNTDEILFGVTVEDTTPPTITWKEDAVLYLNENGFAFATYNALIEATDDNCGIDAGGFEVNTFDCSDVGFNNVNYSQVDFHGNGITHSRNVLIIDTIKPKFTLQEIDLMLDSEGNAALTEEMLLPYATDNCGVAEVAIQHQSYNCSQLGEGETQIIVFDMNGNFLQRTLFVNLTDEFAPSASAENMEIELNEDGEAHISLDMVNFNYSDNCDQIEVSLSQTSFNCEDGPSATVILTATDAAGNTSEAPFTVSLVDNHSPEIICSGPVTRCEGILQEETLVMAFDNCGYSIAQESGPSPGSLVLPGAYEIVYTATDNYGNSATCAVPMTILPQPSVELGEDFSVAPGSVVTLSANQFEPGFDYLWSNGATSPSIQLSVTEEITVSVVVSAAGTCIAEDEVTIGTDLISSINSADGTFGLNIYPNPSKNIVNIEIGVSERHDQAGLTMVDLNGRVVYQETVQAIIPGQVLSIDISQLAKGLYVLSIETETAVATTKIVKE